MYKTAFAASCDTKTNIFFLLAFYDQTLKWWKLRLSDFPFVCVGVCVCAFMPGSGYFPMCYVCLRIGTLFYYYRVSPVVGRNHCTTLCRIGYYPLSMSVFALYGSTACAQRRGQDTHRTHKNRYSTLGTHAFTQPHWLTHRIASKQTQQQYIF